MADEKQPRNGRDKPAPDLGRSRHPAPGGNASRSSSGLQPGGTKPAGGKRGGFGSIGTGGGSSGPEDGNRRAAGEGHKDK